MTKTYQMNNLIEKMASPDQDFRFMALNDLMNEVKNDPSSFQGEEATENKVLDKVMSLVEDKISEVKNQAVKCLGQLIKIVREHQMEMIVDKLIEHSSSKDDELRDIAGLALKTITSELPPEAKIVPKACAKLTPKLLLQAANTSTPPESLIETLAILSILVTRFPAYVSNPEIQPQPLAVLTPLLGHARPAVRKRAIVTLSQFLPFTPAESFPQVVQSVLVPGLAPSANLDQQRTIVQLVGGVGRYSPQKIAPVLADLVPGVLNACNRDDAELRESALQTLEVLVLRCPSEIGSYLNSILGVSAKLLKYDPNYAGDDEDEDEEMEDGDDDDDDAGDDYSDDEDTSYKIRRSAAKVLTAIIGTRPELLVPILKSVSPVIISRFGDREETVKLEVWATYVALLNQVRLTGGAPGSKDDATVGGKRKRDDDMELEETPYALLKTQVPALAKVLLKQLRQPKSAGPTLQAGFNVLQNLSTVLPGSLSAFAVQVIDTSRAVLSTSSNTSNYSLHTAVLSFLCLFFSSHSPTTYAASLPSILPNLLSSVADKHPRVAIEAFRTFSALLTALKPVKGQAWPEQVYEQTVARLASTDTDAEVREHAEEVIRDLWVCATDSVRNKGGREWELLLRTQGRPDGAVKVIDRVARDVPDMPTAWVTSSIDWVLSVLRRSGRGGRGEAFAAIDALLRAYGPNFPPTLPGQLLPQLAPYVSLTDIALLAHTLGVFATLLQVAPKQTFPLVERQVLPTVYSLAPNPLVVGTALDSLLAFFVALVEADPQITSHVVLNIGASIDRVQGQVAPANVAKVVRAIVNSQRGVAAGAIAEYSKYIKPPARQPDIKKRLALLTLGEIGRIIDLSPQAELFNIALQYFSSDSEELRSAAAFAVGNIAIGNPNTFLPLILNVSQSNKDKQLLSLHALREFVTNSSHGQLEIVADSLWAPLFQNSDADEATRNVSAACLGKLTTASPSKYLPQLQSRLRDPAPPIRATVIAAIRYTFADTAQSYDELLSPFIVDFLLLVEDKDLKVRQEALSALNTAAKSKPQLIREHLTTLVPALYTETKIKEELIRTVQMGPWQHKVDDGLEARKTAYETIYTLLETNLTRLDLAELLSRVIAGLKDTANDIQTLCHMMVFRLAQLAPAAVAARIGDFTEDLTKAMAGPAVTKDTVKQDLERAQEQQKSALRAIAALSKVNTPGTYPKFDELIASVSKGQWAGDFQDLVDKF